MTGARGCCRAKDGRPADVHAKAWWQTENGGSGLKSIRVACRGRGLMIRFLFSAFPRLVLRLVYTLFSSACFNLVQSESDTRICNVRVAKCKQH